MRFVPILAAAAGLIAAAPAAHAMSCAPAETLELSNFAGDGGVAKATLFVDGSSCDRMVVRVEAADGRKIYEDAWPLAQVSNAAGEPFEPAEALEVTGLTASAPADYPSAAELRANPDAVEGDFSVLGADAVFDRARASGRPALCYGVSFVEARCVWFDDQSGQTAQLFGIAG